MLTPVDELEVLVLVDNKTDTLSRYYLVILLSFCGTHKYIYLSITNIHGFTMHVSAYQINWRILAYQRAAAVKASKVKSRPCAAREWKSLRWYFLKRIRIVKQFLTAPILVILTHFLWLFRAVLNAVHYMGSHWWWRQPGPEKAKRCFSTQVLSVHSHINNVIFKFQHFPT